MTFTAKVPKETSVSVNTKDGDVLGATITKTLL